MKIIDFESHYMPLEFKELASQRKEGEFPRYLKDEDIYIGDIRQLVIDKIVRHWL